jgi:hypothetical protein
MWQRQYLVGVKETWKNNENMHHVLKNDNGFVDRRTVT